MKGNAKNCAFCGTPDIKNRTVFEGPLVWAFLTNIPITPGHTLVAPQRCASTWEELTREEKIDIFECIERVKKMLRKAFSVEGFHHAWNEGEVAGQTVPHFHLHIVPRETGDMGITGYEPRQFLYRPGSRETSPEAELREISRIIRQNT